MNIQNQGPRKKLQVTTNCIKPNKTRKETSRSLRETKQGKKRHGIREKQKRRRKYNKNRNRHGNFEPSLKSKITSTANLSRANSQERRILKIPEEFKHTKFVEIDNHL